MPASTRTSAAFADCYRFARQDVLARVIALRAEWGPIDDGRGYRLTSRTFLFEPSRNQVLTVTLTRSGSKFANLP
jgi:hypothetical protein